MKRGMGMADLGLGPYQGCTQALLRTWDLCFWGQLHGFEELFQQRLVSLPSHSKQTAGVTPSTIGLTASMTGVTAALPHCPPGR